MAVNEVEEYILARLKLGHDIKQIKDALAKAGHDMIDIEKMCFRLFPDSFHEVHAFIDAELAKGKDLFLIKKDITSRLNSKDKTKEAMHHYHRKKSSEMPEILQEPYVFLSKFKEMNGALLNTIITISIIILMTLLVLQLMQFIHGMSILEIDRTEAANYIPLVPLNQNLPYNEFRDNLSIIFTILILSAALIVILVQIIRFKTKAIIFITSLIAGYKLRLGQTIRIVNSNHIIIIFGFFLCLIINEILLLTIGNIGQISSTLIMTAAIAISSYFIYHDCSTNPIANKTAARLVFGIIMTVHFVICIILLISILYIAPLWLSKFTLWGS